MEADAPSDRPETGGADAPPRSRLHRPDLIVTAVVLAICAGLYVNTLYFDEVPSSLAQNVQPATFPRLVLIVIAAIAFLLPFEYARKIGRGTDLDAERAERPGAKVLVTAVALVVLVALMPWLGVLPALILIATTVPILWGERRWKILVPYLLVFPVSVYLLFSEILQVSFPRGIFSALPF